MCCVKLSPTEHIFQTAHVSSMTTRVLLSALIHFLIPQALLASTCSVRRGACEIENAQAISTIIQYVAKHDLSPMSCLTFCATRQNCIGMNEKKDSDVCQLLEEDDIIPGLEWYYNSQGYSFWSFEKTCPKVRRFCVVIMQTICCLLYGL